MTDGIPGTGPIWLDDVHCNPESIRLGDCYHRPFGQHNCGHFKDVAVQCLHISMYI